jgi:3-oxoacyl-[acyl-carrier protein] reductase
MGKVLENKVCLITGAAKGIGKAIAEKFAENGAIVYANDIEDGSMDKWAVEQFKDHHSIIKPLYFDVCDFDKAKQAILQIKNESGGIQVLVNNAGIVSYEYLNMIDFSLLRKMFEVNVISNIYLIQLVSRLMTRQKGGSIINMASIVGVKGAKGQLAYSATKGAVVSVTKSASKELAESGIRVNAIAPGMVATERLKRVMEDKFSDKVNDIGFKRLASPTEIAELALFLASDKSNYITGQVISIDGGLIL